MIPISETYIDHDPESLTPAPGWRAVYLLDDPPGWSAEPLVCFAICHITTKPCTGPSRVVDELGREVHGYVYADDYIACAEDVGNYWRYLAPGEPDPTDDQVQAARSRRAKRIA